jgi:hypothetical protein
LHWSQNPAVWPWLLVAVHWAGLLHSWPYVPGWAFWHRFIIGGSCGRVTIPATTLREGLALALSSCGDWDYPAGESVGLLGLGSVGSESDNLAAVGALAQCTNGACHVVGRLSWANQHGAAFGCGAVLWGVHGDNYGDWETVGGELVGVAYIIGG